MSQYSTSKMLDRLSSRQSNTQSDEILNPEIEKIDDLAVLQLTPSVEPKMEHVLNQILGASFSKKYSPMDK